MDIAFPPVVFIKNASFNLDVAVVLKNKAGADYARDLFSGSLMTKRLARHRSRAWACSFNPIDQQN